MRPMDADILEWVHRHHDPVWNAVFRLSHELATLRACGTIVGVMVLWHLWRRQVRLAIAWIVLGLSVGWLTEIIKAVVARPRPALFTPLVIASGYSFPSAHATVAASLFPLLARVVAGSRPRRAGRTIAWCVFLALGAFVSAGRVYLGVHWPTDVVAGWLLGAVLYAVTARWLGPTGARRGRPPPAGNGHGGDDPTQGHTRNPGRARTRHPV